eukprot:15366124-Ditylum_brightwellii.AAC.1
MGYHRWKKDTTIFTVDATAMYSNIDVDHCITAMEEWPQDHKDEFSNDFPTELIIKSPILVMKSNVFSFGDTWWVQLIGVAMGTPCACIITMLYFGLFKHQFLLLKYKKWLCKYRRFIDDVLTVWKLNNDINASLQAFENFKQDIDKFGILRWKTESLAKLVDFVDLTISIHEDRSFKFKTHQKDLNLHLYSPPHSDHLPGVIKSTVLEYCKTIGTKYQ